MKLEHLETPALILDLDIVEENIQTMNQLLSGSNISLRPHYKSHKCTTLAHMQIASGAKGMTCAKLSEAEDLIFSGIEAPMYLLRSPAQARKNHLESISRSTLL